MTKKHLTLLEEAQHRAEYNLQEQCQREMNEETYISLMEGVKELSQPGTRSFSPDELLVELGLVPKGV